MMDNIEAAEVLRGAAQHIEKNGWCRGNLQSASGHVCMWGGIFNSLAQMNGKTDPVDMYESDEAEDMELILAPFFPGERFPFIGSDFNDWHAQSQEDVIKKLNEIADVIEFQE